MAWEVARLFGPRFRTLLGDFALLYLVPLPLLRPRGLAVRAGELDRASSPRSRPPPSPPERSPARYWQPFRTFFKGEPAAVTE